MPSPKIVLGGDVGGTKTLLKLAEVNARGVWKSLREQRYESCAYQGFESIVEDFLRGDVPDSACFGVAGPVKDNMAKITFLPWFIESDSISEVFGIRDVKLINDFQAAGYGIDALEDGDLLSLNSGKPEIHGPRSLIGAGTFLGEGLLVWQRDGYVALSSEGGHADFAPRGSLQAELLMSINSRAGEYVPYGSLLSGNGLAVIYEFLHEHRGMTDALGLLSNKGNADLPLAVSQGALLHNDPLASAALDLFIDIYGAEAGNMALRTLPTGGVYITGGIAPQIVLGLTNGRFMRAFLDKGGFSTLLSDIPVAVVLNPKVGLLGAMLCAARMQAN